MRARVRTDSRLSAITACGGVQFTKREWTNVPPDRTLEASGNPYLEIEVVDNVIELSENVPDTVGYRASAAAEKLAKLHGIDLATVIGTGVNGQITKGDVESWIGEEEDD